MRCGCLGLPHCGHRLTRGASIRCVARRLSRRAFEVFFLGTAMSRAIVATIAASPRALLCATSRSHPGPRPCDSQEVRRMRAHGGTLAATDISKSHGGDVVLDRISLVVPPRARVGVVGPNGAGKTTLLRVLAGLEEPDSGRVTRRPGDLTVRFLAQQRERAGLSGGEAARAALREIFEADDDVLLLDEPTNDVDFDGLRLLERFVARTPAAIVVVSHDRAFLEPLVDRIVEFEGETRRVREFAGSWGDFEGASRRASARAARARRETLGALAPANVDRDARPRRRRRGAPRERRHAARRLLRRTRLARAPSRGPAGNRRAERQRQDDAAACPRRGAAPRARHTARRAVDSLRRARAGSLLVRAGRASAPALHRADGASAGQGPSTARAVRAARGRGDSAGALSFTGRAYARDACAPLRRRRERTHPRRADEPPRSRSDRGARARARGLRRDERARPARPPFSGSLRRDRDAKASL